MRTLIFTIFLFAYGAAAQTPCEQMITDAEKAVQKENYRDAILKLQAARKCDPARSQEIDELILDTFSKIETLKIQSEKTVQTLGVLLGEITDLLQKDENASIIGLAPLQNEILQLILPNYEYIKENTGGSSYDWEVARIHYSKAFTKEKMGEGDYLSDYQIAYEQSLNAIEGFSKRGRPIPEKLILTLLESAYYYSWHLMNRERNEEAEQMLSTAYEISRNYQDRSANLYKGLAGIENSLARLAVEKSKDKEALTHYHNAITYINRAITIDSTNLVYKRGLAAYQRNIALLPDSVLSAEDKTHYERAGCDLAGIIESLPGSGNIALLTDASCKYNSSYDLTRENKYDEAMQLLATTADDLEDFLHLDPQNTNCSLLIAAVVSRMAEIANLQGNEEDRLNYLIRAKDNWVRVFDKGSVLPLDLIRLKATYDKVIQALDLMTKRANGMTGDKKILENEKKVKFLEDITSAFSSSATDYGEITTIAHIAADSYSRMGELYRDKDYLLAQDYFERARKYFENTKLLSDTSEHNDKYEWYCKAIYKQLLLNCENDKIDLAVDGLRRMEALFSPIIEKYPFDYYLRQYFWWANWYIGNWYFSQGEYENSKTYLEFASRWGISSATEKLAILYRKGEYGKVDFETADSLDRLYRKQVKKRFTILCDVSGNQKPYNIYIQNYPREFEYRGIDDFSEYFSKYDTKVPYMVRLSFLKLHKLADDHDVSFAKLSGHFIEEGESIENKAFDKIAIPDSISISSKMDEYKEYVAQYKDKVTPKSKDEDIRDYLNKINDIIEFYQMFDENDKALELAQHRTLLEPSNTQHFRILAKIQLRRFEIASKGNVEIDNSTFLTSDHLGALGEYYRYFLRKRDRENIMYFLNKILKNNNYSNIKFILYKYINEYGMDLFSEIYLDQGIEQLKEDISYFKKQILLKSATGYRVSLYEAVVRLDDHLLILQDDLETRETVAQDYNSLAWYQLLTGRFKEAEVTLNKGIEIYEDNPYFYTNVPPALLFQGRVKEAKELYLFYKDMDFDADAGYPKYKDAFLDDFESFEKERIIPDEYRKHIKEIITMLKTDV